MPRIAFLGEIGFELSTATLAQLDLVHTAKWYDIISIDDKPVRHLVPLMVTSFELFSLSISIRTYRLP